MIGQRIAYFLLLAIPFAVPDAIVLAMPQAAADKSAEKKSSPASPPRPSEQNPAGTGQQQLNLKGTTDTSSGESRRNDNIQFNPIDNNALRDLNLRLGVVATLVREFEIQNRYFSSECGTRPQLPIHVLPQYAKAVHGSIFETHGNSVFSARSFFQVGKVKPAHENNYGFNLVAPVGESIVLSLDGGQQRVRGSVNGNVLVPNANERTPLTSDPEIRPLVQRILSAYPAELPNRTDIDDRALNTNSPQSIDTDRISGTLERPFGMQDKLLLRYSLTSQRVQSFQFVAGQNYNSDVRGHAAKVTWNRKWSPATVTELSLGFDRVRSSLQPEAWAQGAGIQIFIIQPVGSANNPLNRAINDFQYAGQLVRSEKKHQWRAGFNILRRQLNGSESNGHRGTFLFADGFGRDAVTNLRLGTAIRYNQTIGETARGYRNWGVTFFAGDTWRVRPNLTLNFGLRYEATSPPVEVDNLDVIPYSCDCNNVAPSLGIAQQLPSSWGTLRAAYSIQYGQIFPVTYGQIRFNPPLNIGLSVDEPKLAHPLAGLDLGNLPPNTRSSLTELSPELVTPYSHQYNLSWEPGSWKSVRLQLGYVGSRTLKLFSSWSMNRAVPVPGIERTLATINQRRPDPNHYMIQRVANGSRAYYDAGRISVVIPQQRGWSLDASYWFSKSIDLNYNYPETGYGSIPFPQVDSMIDQDLRGLSSFDQPHAFLGRGSYDMPALARQSAWVRSSIGGWTFSWVLLLKSGTPFTVFAGSDSPGIGNVDGESADRVDVVNPSILGRTIGYPDTATSLLPRTAFAFMSSTALRGNIGRNTFRKGKISNVNAVLSRTWKLKDDLLLAFRAESVNLLNIPQFADPERNLVSKTFGRISNTLNLGRTFQFHLRLSF